MESQNITLALPKTLLKKVRVVAAKRETSVSALVAAALRDVVREDEDESGSIGRALGRLRRGYSLGTDGLTTPARDGLHER